MDGGGGERRQILRLDRAKVPLRRDVEADRLVLPASTAKIPTAVAALSVLGPDRSLVTRITAGARPDTVVLVGGGDPTLRGTVGTFRAGSSLQQLAAVGARVVGSVLNDPDAKVARYGGYYYSYGYYAEEA